MRGNDGIGLIELLVVVAIVGILVGVGYTALPRQGFAVNQAVEGLARDFQLARFEAIRRNEFVGIQGDAAADEYHLVIDVDRDDLLEPSGGDTVIKTVAVGAEQGLDLAAADDFIFDPRGLATRLATATVTVRSLAGSHTRSVCVSAQGHTSMVDGTGC